MTMSSNRAGLPWLLAESLRAQIQNVQAPLSGRTNLTALISAITHAILDADGTRLNQADKEMLDSVLLSIDMLRRTYEPIMDSVESIDATSMKRTDYMLLLDIATRQLMYIVHKYKLVDAGMMREGDAKKWGQ